MIVFLFPLTLHSSSSCFREHGFLPITYYILLGVHLHIYYLFSSILYIYLYPPRILLSLHHALRLFSLHHLKYTLASPNNSFYIYYHCYLTLSYHSITYFSQRIDEVNVKRKREQESVAQELSRQEQRMKTSVWTSMQVKDACGQMEDYLRSVGVEVPALESAVLEGAEIEVDEGQEGEGVEVTMTEE
jgi:Breast carcinoma amplified sequence 2 (BCAS2)